MLTIVDPVRSDSMFHVHDNAEGEHCRDDRGKRSGGRNHEHDDHLETRCLFNGGPSENGTRHHAWNSDDPKDAVSGTGKSVKNVRMGSWRGQEDEKWNARKGWGKEPDRGGVRKRSGDGDGESGEG